MPDEAVVVPEIEAVVEAPVITPEIPVEAPQDNVVVPEVEQYQDIVAKYNEDNTYQMTDEEADIFLNIGDQINTGKMEDPGLKKSEPEAKIEPEAKSEPEVEAPKEELTNSDHDATYEAMKKVGAKHANELPEKIDGLLKTLHESGGNLGQENKSLKETIAKMKTSEDNHIAWLSGLKSNNPDAIKYLNETVGYKSSPTVSTNNTEISNTLVGDINPDEAMDPDMARYLNSMRADNIKMKEALDTITAQNKETQDQALTRTVTQEYIDGIVTHVTSDEMKAHYGLTSSEARGLAEAFYKDPNSVHPKFQKVYDIIKYANDNNFPTLKSAHLMMQHENGDFAKALVEATKKGQEATQFTPSVNTELSSKQGRAGNNVPQPTITEDTITRIEQGHYEEIPDSWTNKDGTLIPSAIPLQFRDRVLGKGQK